MVNFLEQMVAEWYEFRGYFVRRNVRVGPRPKEDTSQNWTSSHITQPENT